MINPLTLAVETATRAGSVAVARGERVLASHPGDATVSHSANLIEMIEQVLAQSAATLTEVNLFAVAEGPGSFTGLRIGLATVKALAVCTGREVVGVSTLAAMARASGASGTVVSLLPAGRGEMFAQLFSVEQGIVKPIDAAEHLSPQALLEKYGQMAQLTFTGEAARQQLEVLRTWAEARNFKFNQSGPGSAGWQVVEQSNHLATSVAALALNDYRDGKAVSAAQLHAVYVRASDAEINQRWQQQKAQR